MSTGMLILDACALIAVQRGEPGGDMVIDRILASASGALMHGLNVCEVFYDDLRRDEKATISRLLTDLARLEIRIEWGFGESLVDRTARIKAHWRRISLADSAALALAMERGGILLTSDHHELDPLFAAGYPIEFIR